MKKGNGIVNIHVLPREQGSTANTHSAIKAAFVLNQIMQIRLTSICIWKSTEIYFQRNEIWVVLIFLLKIKPHQTKSNFWSCQCLYLTEFFLFFSASTVNLNAEDPGYSAEFKFLDACLDPFHVAGASSYWQSFRSHFCSQFSSAVSCGPRPHPHTPFVLMVPAGLAVFPHLFLSSCSCSPRVYFPFEIYFIPATAVSILCHIDHLLPGVPSSLSHGLLLDVVTFDYSNASCCFPSWCHIPISYIIMSIWGAPWPFLWPESDSDACNERQRIATLPHERTQNFWSVGWERINPQVNVMFSWCRKMRKKAYNFRFGKQ